MIKRSIQDVESSYKTALNGATVDIFSISATEALFDFNLYSVGSGGGTGYIQVYDGASWYTLSNLASGGQSVQRLDVPGFGLRIVETSGVSGIHCVATKKL